MIYMYLLYVYVYVRDRDCFTIEEINSSQSVLDSVSTLCPLLLRQVKGRLQARLHDLEPLPELLKTTELRLFEAQERLAMHEKKASENAQLIAQLTAKVRALSLREIPIPSF